MFTLTTTFASYVSQNRFMKKEDREIKHSEGLLPQDIFKCQNSIEQTTGEGGQKGMWRGLDEGHGRLTVMDQDRDLTLRANLELPILKMKIIRTCPTFVRMYYMNACYWDSLWNHTSFSRLYVSCLFRIKIFSLKCIAISLLTWETILCLQAKKKDELDQHDKNPKLLSYFMLFYHWSSHVQRSAIIKRKISELCGTFLETAVATTPLSCLKPFKSKFKSLLIGLSLPFWLFLLYLNKMTLWFLKFTPPLTLSKSFICQNLANSFRPISKSLSDSFSFM